MEGRFINQEKNSAEIIGHISYLLKDMQIQVDALLKVDEKFSSTLTMMKRTTLLHLKTMSSELLSNLNQTCLQKNLMHFEQARKENLNLELSVILKSLCDSISILVNHQIAVDTSNESETSSEESDDFDESERILKKIKLSKNYNEGLFSSIEKFEEMQIDGKGELMPEQSHKRIMPS